MQDTDSTYADIHSTQPERARGRRARRLPHVLSLAFVLLLFVLMFLLPPLVSVNRFQRRIATSISESLGRPVHLDSVTLNLLPLPGFTLNNLVVDEDPAFGSEPVIRANSVRATLRISSLWRKRVEFSTISFTEPSVNLVHTAAGKWNLESILLQASRIQAAPTSQKKPGPAPRFPYIEATGARVNLKMDQEKVPIAFTDADFALWLPEPEQWHLRIQARPARTDTNVSDTGILQLEGTLGRAASLGQVPINLQGEWNNAPLGEASRVLLGRDAGLRGNMRLSAIAKGTVNDSALEVHLRLTDARRADFVPDRTLNVDMECLAAATSAFHTFDNIRCSWPPAEVPQTVAISGSIPDIRKPTSSAFDIGTPGIPASTLLDWLRVASARVPLDITAAGTFTGSLSYHPNSPSPLHWDGKMLLKDASLITPETGRSSLLVGDVAVSCIDLAGPDPRHTKRHPAPPPPVGGFVLAPTSLALGGKEPATLDGHFDTTGYTLHLTGMASTARLQALAAALPQLGDGLAEVLPTNRATGPFRIDLTATRPWHGPQTWTDVTAHPTTHQLPALSKPHR